MKTLIKNTIFSAVIACLLISCGQIKYVPVETIKEVHTIDSVYFRDTVINYEVEKEYIERYATDTLRMETQYSNFEAYQDTSVNKLKGRAWNKERTINIPTQVKEKVVYRDSVIVKEVPVEVKVPEKYVPAIYKWSLRVNIIIFLLLIALGYFIWRTK